MPAVGQRDPVSENQPQACMPTIPWALPARQWLLSSSRIPWVASQGKPATLGAAGAARGQGAAAGMDVVTPMGCRPRLPGTGMPPGVPLAAEGVSPASVPLKRVCEPWVET